MPARWCLTARKTRSWPRSRANARRRRRRPRARATCTCIRLRSRCSARRRSDAGASKLMRLPFFSRAPNAALHPGDMVFMSPVHAAQVLEPAPAAMWAVYLMLIVVASAVGWSAMTQVDIVSKAPAPVVPDGREQVIASLEGGILRELMVREGQQVQEGQELAMLDPTRVEAQQAEGQAKRLG